MKNKKRAFIFIFISVLTLIFSGCSKVEDMKVKWGLKNRDFEYIKQNKIQKIIIQSTRDTGFRFIVTDKRTINDLYDILSTAKSSSEKSNLEPDYVFEMIEGADKVHKFNYVVGIHDKNVGNLYNEDNSYIVSKRIDNDIIKNMSSLRKPRAFEELYYDTILNFINIYENSLPKDKSIGVNISDDIEVAKYILSIDVEDFKINLKNKMSNIDLVNKNKDKFDYLINVKTYGYKTTIYKSIITLQDKVNNNETKYYVLCKYDERAWDIKITKTKPDEF